MIIELEHTVTRGYKDGMVYKQIINTKTGRSNDLPVMHPNQFSVKNTEQKIGGLFVIL